MSVALDQGRATPRVPVTVNGVAIERTDIAREAQFHPSGSPGEAIAQATEALVVRELLLQEAVRRGVVAIPEVDERGRGETTEEALVRALVESAVETPAPRQEEISRYYFANKSRFRSPDIYEASHILIAARRDERTAFDAARAKAQALTADLIEVPGNFVGMARVFSDCPSAREGGFLGQICASEVSPEFAAALKNLSEGEMTSNPVEARYGFHIIRLERRISGETLPLSAVTERIADYLKERSRRTAIAQFVARLASDAQISGVKIANAEAHRVF